MQRKGAPANQTALPGTHNPPTFDCLPARPLSSLSAFLPLLTSLQILFPLSRAPLLPPPPLRSPSILILLLEAYHARFSPVLRPAPAPAPRNSNGSLALPSACLPPASRVTTALRCRRPAPTTRSHHPVVLGRLRRLLLCCPRPSMPVSKRLPVPPSRNGTRRAAVPTRAHPGILDCEARRPSPPASIKHP